MSYDSWPIKSFYTCDVQSISVTDDKETINEVSQNHAPGKTNAHVEVLQINSKTLHYLPRHIEVFFPNLKGITISASGTKVFRRQDIKPFSKLMFIFIYNNDIKAIDGDLFRDNPNIQYVSFTGNPLTNVGPRLLEPLTNQLEFHCYKCKCFDTASLDIKNIEYMKIGLSRNCLPTFDMIQEALEEQTCSECNQTCLELKAENQILKKEIKKLAARVTDSENRIQALFELLQN